MPSASRSPRHWHPAVGLVLALALAGGGALAAQNPFRAQAPRSRPAPVDDVSVHVPYDGRFAFVRLRYNMGGSLGSFRGFRREPPWHHDYPRADRHLMKILQELTLLRPHLDESAILALNDPELHNYPVAYMSEPGYWSMNEQEVQGLRAYLRKGGFVIFDDFRQEHWYNFEEQMRRVLPEQRFVKLDAAHPIFHSFFEIDPARFVSPYGGLTPIFYGLFEDGDPSKRLQAVANYNNDLGEYWEFSDTGWVPIDLSNEAYKFGVNYIVYGMTH
ncbi:MAG: DUF4159 domain-containing protein [Acidobacteria bacterium]|nr:DUF4159 domain-containing protein [Acidobacteriota bacterium]